MLAGSAHAEWEVLFDGRSTATWRSADSEEFPASSWLVKDGLLTTIPDARFDLIDAVHMMPAQAAGPLLALLEDFLGKQAASTVKQRAS